jgi:colicin import membrane protein
MSYVCYLLSLCLHICLILLAMYAPWGSGELRVDLEKPVYEVELVRMPEQKKIVQVPRLSGQRKIGPKQAHQQAKALPKPESKPKAAPAKPAQDRPVQIAKDQHRPKATRVREKKEQKPREEAKATGSEVAKTPERELDEALQEITAQAEQEAQKVEDDLSSTLSALKQEVMEQGFDPDALGRSSSAGGTEKVYGQLVKNRIQTNWRFPDMGREENLQATVRISINDTGEIRDRRLERSSGDSQFDSSVLRAIDRTGKLPDPETDLRTVHITFHLQDMRQ